MRPALSSYLPTTWASDITVAPLSREKLVVIGKLPLLESDLQPSRDPYRRYLASVKVEYGQKGTVLRLI
jgi:hypothetical protein